MRRLMQGRSKNDLRPRSATDFIAADAELTPFGEREGDGSVTDFTSNNDLRPKSALRVSLHSLSFVCGLANVGMKKPATDTRANLQVIPATFHSIFSHFYEEFPAVGMKRTITESVNLRLSRGKTQFSVLTCVLRTFSSRQILNIVPIVEPRDFIVSIWRHFSKRWVKLKLR